MSLSPEVAEALAAGEPVVALESTIITHGMPYPQNLEMAQNVEAVVRERRRGAGDDRDHGRAASASGSATPTSSGWR